MYVGDTSSESRRNWIAALDRLAALNQAMVVAGHKKPGAPDSPSTIQENKRYLVRPSHGLSFPFSTTPHNSGEHDPEVNKVKVKYVGLVMHHNIG